MSKSHKDFPNIITYDENLTKVFEGDANTIGILGRVIFIWSSTYFNDAEIGIGIRGITVVLDKHITVEDMQVPKRGLSKRARVSWITYE